MTYSVSASGTSKAHALELANDQFNAIRERDPIHVNDTVAVQNAVHDLVMALGDTDDSGVSISVSGYANYKGSAGEPGHITGMSASINVALSPRPVAV